LSRIGFLSLSATGHINPSMALAKAMHQRGHEAVFFNVADRERTITERGFKFVPYGLSEYPIGSLAQIFEKMGRLKGNEGFQYFLERMLAQAKSVFRDLPDLITHHDIEALVIDQLFPGGATVAHHLGLPYASLANALAVNFEPGVPPPTLPWPYEDTPLAEARNQAASQQIAQAFTTWRNFDNAQRILWNLKPYDDLLEDSCSPLAQIANQPSVFDFPRKHLPATFHYCGPFLHPEGREFIPFPWEKLDGRPLIFASMGTLQNGLNWTFRAILEACVGLDAQLVLSLGGSTLDSADLGEIPSNAIVVPYAPQPEILARGAALCITHARLNTALESLSHGVPMVAIPVTNDQPGVAARILYTQTGQVVALDQLTAESLRPAIIRVLMDSSYRQQAKRLQQQIAAERPLLHACEVLEQKVLSQIPQSEVVEA
jgi:zeaxanthin glucosyltransferase